MSVLLLHGMYTGVCGQVPMFAYGVPYYHLWKATLVMLSSMPARTER